MKTNELTEDYKKEVVAAMIKDRENFNSDVAFCNSCGFKSSVFTRLKKGENTDLLSFEKWVTIGRRLGVQQEGERKMKLAKTDVFISIEQDIDHCQPNHKAMIFVDDSGIGKTVTAKYLCRTRRNCFYVDASQAKTKQLFIRSIAKAIGVDNTGKYAEVKADIKYYLQMVNNPMIIIDDAGDLEAKAFLELKEFWNATEGFCGWYMIGDDSLKYLIEKSINSKKPGFRALFSRFSNTYSRITPIGKEDRQMFYSNLIRQVLEINMTDKTQLAQLVKKCLTNGPAGQIGDLRRAESILILNA